MKHSEIRRDGLSRRAVLIAPAALACAAAFGASDTHASPPPRHIETFAGTGQKGWSGDGGPAAKAQLNDPFGLIRGPDGALYVCDTDNHRIRRIAPDGTISTVAGSGKRGYAGDGGPALLAELNEPYEVRFGPADDTLFVEMRNHVVRRVDGQTGVISTLAGTGAGGFSGDGGPATRAQFNQPHSLRLDGDGNVFVCDIGNNRVRRVDGKTGAVTTFAGTGAKGATPDGAKIEGTPLNGPRAIEFDRDGNLWLVLREGNAIFKIDIKAGTFRHVAGTGKQGFAGNGGPAKDAALSGPKGVSLGPDGNVYFADTESHSIRMIDVAKGTVELVAGTGERGDGPDGDPLACRLARPHGIFVDTDGSIFVGDSENHRVRVIRPG